MGEGEVAHRFERELKTKFSLELGFVLVVFLFCLFVCFLLFDFFFSLVWSDMVLNKKHRATSQDWIPD